MLHNSETTKQPSAGSFKTTAAYLSGAVCGPIWWPVGALCGTPLRADMRGMWAYPRFDKGDTLRDWLLSLLTHKSGDFQSAQFTADTVIRVERKAIDGAGKYRVHVKELRVGDLPDCDDLVNEDAYVGDFLGEE